MVSLRTRRLKPKDYQGNYTSPTCRLAAPRHPEPADKITTMHLPCSHTPAYGSTEGTAGRLNGREHRSRPRERTWAEAPLNPRTGSQQCTCPAQAMVVSGHLPCRADCYNDKRQLDGAVAASPEFHQRNLRNARAPKNKTSEVQPRNASSDGKPSSPGGSSMALRAQVFARRSAFSAGFSAHPLAHPSEDENRFCRRSLEPLVV